MIGVALGCLVCLGLFAGPSAAGPVATLELGGGRKVTAELAAFSDGAFRVRALNGNRKVMRVPLSRVRAVDFGEIPIELGPGDAVNLPRNTQDVRHLWWAIDGRHFMILLQTCRPEGGRPGRERLSLLSRQIAAELERENLNPERRRDLRLARVILLTTAGRRNLARALFQRLKEDYPNDPVLRRFEIDVWALVALEWGERRGGPPMRRARPRKPRRGVENGPR